MLGRCTLVLLIAFFWAALAVQSEAASVRGSANATVVAVTGAVSSLTELQQALGVLPISTTPQDSEPTGPVLSDPTPLSQVSGGQAAQVSIGGVPNQTFSLSVTNSLVTVTNAGELLITTFNHNAGLSPFIGADGTANVAVGAEAVVGSAEELEAFEVAAGNLFGESINLAQVVIATDAGPQTVTIQRPDHFGPILFGETFFTVLVSYN